MDITYNIPKKERKCVICGDTLLGSRRVLCDKPECKLKRLAWLKKRKGKPQQKEVWILDMNDYTWHLEIRN